MPILIMAVLALVFFGTLGILLVVAVIMEHSPTEHPARGNRSHPETPAARLVEDLKKPVDEHALVG
jgi:hypothetical protein